MQTIEYSHLIGLAAIAKVFKTSRSVVKSWALEGAPIFLVGKVYQARFDSLVAWLENHKRVSTIFQRSTEAR